MWFEEAVNEDVPVNSPDQGLLGLGLGPAIREKIKAGFLAHFLNKLYEEELALAASIVDASLYVANYAVAHADLDDPNMNSLNVAMPDLCAEYWLTFLPDGQRPIVRVTFPAWAIYTALTVYDTSGLPIASLSGAEAAAGSDARSRSLPEGGYMVDLLFDAEFHGPLCLIFRVYRPADVKITPHSELPAVRFAPRDAPQFDPTAGSEVFLPNLSQEDALANGRRIGDKFMSVITSKLKPLAPKQMGSQLFLPRNVSGLFPNANALYVCAFLPSSMKGMRLAFTVPPAEPWRPYYGIMAVDQATTATLASLTGVELGGPSAAFELFVFRTEEEAKAAGYNSALPAHKLLLWGNVVTRPGVVVRYLHYFDVAAGLTEAQAAAANTEISALRTLNGTFGAVKALTVPGVGEIKYHGHAATQPPPSSSGCSGCCSLM